MRDEEQEGKVVRAVTFGLNGVVVLEISQLLRVFPSCVECNCILSIGLKFQKLCL